MVTVRWRVISKNKLLEYFVQLPLHKTRTYKLNKKKIFGELLYYNYLVYTDPVYFDFLKRIEGLPKNVK